MAQQRLSVEDVEDHCDSRDADSVWHYREALSLACFIASPYECTDFTSHAATKTNQLVVSFG